MEQGFKTGFSQTSLFFLFKWRPNGGNPHGKIDYLLAAYKIIWLRKPTPKFALFWGSGGLRNVKDQVSSIILRQLGVFVKGKVFGIVTQNEMI